MPLVYCEHFSKADTDELRHMVLYHARAGLERLEHLRRLYTTRYQMPLLSFCVLHLGDVLVRESNPDVHGTEVVTFCLEMLAKTQAGFAICGPLSSLFRRTAELQGISLSPDIDDKIGRPTQYTVDDILDACTRLAYTMPLDQTFRHIDRAIATEWGREWERQVVATQIVETSKRSHRPSNSEQYMQIGALLND